MRQSIVIRRFLNGLGEAILVVGKNPKFMLRGGEPLWVIKRVLAEWRFRQAEVDPLQMVAILTGAVSEDINRVLDEVKSNAWLSEYCKTPMYLIQYLLVRILKPETVVETGVAGGYSSATILQALENNGLGQLYSIDLPPDGQILTDGYTYSLPGGRQVGWAVADMLRHRWHLILGDSSQELPSLLPKLGRIDIFIHDSLHTEKHMMFEYQTAWSFIKQGGLLLSDNIGVSFPTFCQGVNHPYVCVNSLARFFGGVSK